MAIYSGFSHEKWWFSIAMLNYQRVPEGNQLKLRPAIKSVIKAMFRFELLVETLQDPSISGQHPLLQIAAWSNTCILLYIIIHVPNLMNITTPLHGLLHGINPLHCTDPMAIDIQFMAPKKSTDRAITFSRAMPVSSSFISCTRRYKDKLCPDLRYSTRCSE